MIMLQNSKIKCFFKKTKDNDPGLDFVVDFNKDVTLKENIPTKRIYNDVASPSLKKKLCLLQYSNLGNM